ncbi:MAG: xanthine dehydrogenase family protein subunit M [Betaproteobacteria bacterium]|nr:xanthine dehydrogenase family protein subunit M [Betaproteobacteria bacterium]
MAIEYFEPTSVAEAAALAARFGASASFIAGGTDLVIQMRRGLRHPAQLIDLQRIAGLDAIAIAGGQIRIGGLTRHRAIERNPYFRASLHALVESAEVIGGFQVRNVGTVGGNLCNASPAADLSPILLVLDATVHLAGTGGERTLPLADFLQGPGRTGRAPDELLTAVSCAAPPPASATAFIKQGRRAAMEISVVSVAALVTLAADGRCLDARIAVGAAAPQALRMPAVESMLRGAALSEAALAEAGRIAAAACAPLSDVRASAAYRRHLVRVLVPRALRRCVQRVTGVTP